MRKENDGPLSLPVWMTELSAAEPKMVVEPRLSVAALLELRRWTTSYLSSLVSQVLKGACDAATSDTTKVLVRDPGGCTGSEATGGRTVGGGAKAAAVDADAGHGAPPGARR